MTRPSRRAVKGTSGHSHGVGIEEVADLGKHGQESARSVEVLHEEGPGRLQVHEEWDGRRAGRSRPGSA